MATFRPVYHRNITTPDETGQLTKNSLLFSILPENPKELHHSSVLENHNMTFNDINKITFKLCITFDCNY